MSSAIVEKRRHASAIINAQFILHLSIHNSRKLHFSELCYHIYWVIELHAQYNIVRTNCQELNTNGASMIIFDLTKTTTTKCKQF